jgi:hypothetical protein
MSTEIEKHYIPTFKNNVELLAQQRKSRLEQLVTVVPCEGLAVAVRDQYGLVTARRKTERHEDTKYSDTPRARRWLTPVEFYTAELYDESDLKRMLTDPQSSLIDVHTAAMNRAKDGLILSCVSAAAPTGETATTGTTAYDTGNDIALAASGLTPPKLIAAKGRLMRNKVDVDTEVPNVIINTKGWEDMFGQATYTSVDYNAMKPLAQAPTAIFYGGSNLTQIEHADFPVNGSTDYRCPYFVKSGIVLGVWGGRQVTVQRMPNKVSSWEVKIVERFNAVRVEEAKVGRILIAF